MRCLWTALVVGVVLPQAFAPTAHAQKSIGNEASDTTRIQEGYTAIGDHLLPRRARSTPAATGSTTSTRRTGSVATQGD